MRELEEEREELRSEKTFTENALNSLSDVFFVFDLNGKFLRWNRRINAVLGYSDAEISSMRPADFFLKEDSHRVNEAIEAVVKNGYAGVEAEALTKDGRNIPYELSGTLLTNHEGKPVGICGIGRDITDRKQSEEKIKESEETYRNIFQNAQVGLFRTGISDGEILESNEQLAKMFGYDKREDFIAEYKTYDKYVDPGKREKMLHEIKKNGFVKNFEARFYRKDGSVFWTNYSAKLYSDKGWIEGVVEDITARKRVEDQLKFRNILLQTQQEASIDGILVVDENGRIISFNRRFVHMWNIPLDVMETRLDENVLKSALDKIVDPQSFLHKVQFLYANKQETSRDEIALRDGRTFDRYSAPMFGEEGRYYGRVWYFRDITERKKAEERIEYLAYYDALTGLPNRNLFSDRLKQGVARAEPASKIVAVLITDIDRFRSINDTYGNEVGNSVLKEVAERLSTAVRKGDTVARLGNDEFGIAFLDVANLDDVIPLIEKIMKYISSPLIDNDEIGLTFSTGVSMYPHDSKNADDLIKYSGLALGIAKEEGGRTCKFYTEDLNVKASEFVLMEKNLHNAMKNEELLLHYQPYWGINDQKMVGMEALVRWQSKDIGLVPPGKFIPVLEDTGMIVEVGEWILRAATRQVREWQNKGYPVVPVSVNLSPIQFRQKNLAETVKKVMGECGYHPSLLTLEITESAFMQDIEFTSSVLKKLKNIGVSVSIDDFGTGYSSLSYLKRFPIDNLKIDISFIRDVVTDPDSASIVMAIINMAHTLNLRTIAEGIETEEQMKFLRLLRCDMGQGFYLSKPLPAEEVEKLLNAEYK